MGNGGGRGGNVWSERGKDLYGFCDRIETPSRDAA